MGYYVNPRNTSKEEFLDKEGVRINDPSLSQLLSILDDPEDGIVCLVDNGPFRAAAICYNEGEILAFHDPNDSRPKKWFKVSKKRLCEEGDITMGTFEKQEPSR